MPQPNTSRAAITYCAALTLAYFIAFPTSDAQATQDSTKRRALAPVVVTATPVARPSTVTNEPGGLPTPVTVVTHEELDRTNVTRDAGAMLRHVPGIMAHNLGQGETGNSVKMRGFATSTHGADVAVYVDGLAQNVPSSAIAHGMNDMNWLTPDMIERIEVIKGPFSALYGDQNRAGAINIITRRSGASSVAGVHSSFNTNRTAAVLSAETGALTSFLVGDRIGSGGYRVNSDEQRGTVLLKESYTALNGIWAARGVYHKSTWNAPGFLNINGLIAGPLRPTDRDTTTPPLYGDANRASVVLTRDPQDGGNGLHLSAFSEDYKRTRALGANTKDLNVQRDDRRITGARALESIQWRNIAAVAVGVDGRHDRGDAINRRITAAVPSANYTFDQDLNLATYGVFVQGQIKPFEQLKLVGGLRRDRFDYDIANRKLPAASVKYDKSITTPRFGVVVSPGARFDIFANYGEGFRSPNQTEISPSGSLGALGASGGTSYPDLAVSRVLSRDIGFTVRPTDRVQVYAAGYHTLNENEISQVTPGVFQSIGNTTRDGWELESRFTATERLNGYASYGRIIRAQINNAAAGAADRLTVPKHTIKGGLGYTLPMGERRLLLNADASYISSVPYFAGTPLTVSFGRQYTRLDLRGTYELNQLQISGFATSQPVQYSSEVATSSAAGALIDPRPSSEIGVMVRYVFRQ